jgi:hypothetical protein
MKKIIFGLIASVFMSVLSINAQSKDLVPVDIGFGLISPTIGDCMKGPAFCSTGTTMPIDFSTSFAAFSKSSSDTVKLLFSEKFFNENRDNLSKGLNVEISTTIQSDLAKRLGFDKEFEVATGTYKVTKKDGKYEVILARKK